MRRQLDVVESPTFFAISARGMSESFCRQSRICLSKESSDNFSDIRLTCERGSQECRKWRKTSNPVPGPDGTLISMIRRFTDHPASVAETYFEHMGTAFG